MIKNYDQLVKLILIGGSGVGKSSLMMRYTNGTFDEEYRTTIGVDFKFHTVKNQGKIIKFQIWDTAGQERFKNIISNYYKGVDGIIMVYDLTDPNSVNELERYWIPQVYQHCSKDIKVLVLGNKNDADSQINTAKVEKIVKSYGFTTQKVSAMTGEKVNDSITKFGIGIAMAKMQIANKMKSSQSIHIFKTLSAINSQKTVQKQQKYHSSQPKYERYPPTKTIQKSLPKHVIISKMEGRPSYQKKCC